VIQNKSEKGKLQKKSEKGKRKKVVVRQLSLLPIRTAILISFFPFSFLALIFLAFSRLPSLA